MLRGSPFDSCPACSGLVPTLASACPNCGEKRSAWKRVANRAAVAVAGAGFATTLMACYGPPPREYQKMDALPPAPSASASSTPKAVAPPDDTPKAK